MNTRMNNGYKIKADAISHNFKDDGGEVNVLRDISFSVKEGEFFTILGPSGCGKSTLLRIIAGMIKSTKGKARFSGGDGNQNLTMIFQSFALFPWLTVYGNVDFGLKMKVVPAKTRHELVMEHIDEIGLRGFENLYPKDLSGGMKQRVGIARALAMNPEVLLMDEAFSSLDAFTADKLRKEILDLWLKDKMTIVMVTHLVDEAIEMSDRVLVMTPRPGRVEAIVDINLPRPRNKRSQDFFSLVDKINDLVKI